MSEIKRPWTQGPWLIDNLTVYTLTHGVGRDGRHQYKRGEPVMENAWWVTPQKARSYISDEELSANARLISAAPDLAEALLDAMRVEVGRKTTIHMAEAFRHGMPAPENIEWPPWFVAARAALRKAGMECL